MEMHHKLRRDPNWHPSACNICGHLGHQAAQCTNGTINWRQLYGDESFRLKQPLYESDLLKIHAAKEVDLADLEAKAKQYAAMRKDAPEGVAANGQPGFVKPELQQQRPAPVQPSAAPQELPAGWAETKDQAGRTYYWHTKTKKTTWERPTAATPINP